MEWEVGGCGIVHVVKEAGGLLPVRRRVRHGQRLRRRVRLRRRLRGRRRRRRLRRRRPRRRRLRGALCGRRRLTRFDSSQLRLLVKVDVAREALVERRGIVRRRCGGSRERCERRRATRRHALLLRLVLWWWPVRLLLLRSWRLVWLVRLVRRPLRR